MSTSLLYHGFGIHGYRHERCYFEEGKVIFRIAKDQASLRCPCCSSRLVSKRGGVLRWFQALPIGKKQIYIALHVPRVECHHCGIVRQIEIGFADPRRTYTKSFGCRSFRATMYSFKISQIANLMFFLQLPDCRKQCSHTMVHDPYIFANKQCSLTQLCHHHQENLYIWIVIHCLLI